MLNLCSNLKFLTIPFLQNLKFGKIKKFESPSNLWFLTNPVMQNVKFGKIKKNCVALKIVLKFKFFDHPGPAKC